MQEKSSEYALASILIIWYGAFMKISEGIYAIPLFGNRAYLIAEKQLILIDTGMPFQARHILRFIKKIGRKPEELALIILTHHHIDHRGNARALQNLTRARIAAHKEDIPYIQGSKRSYRAHLPWWVKVFLFIADILFREEKVSVDDILSENDIVDGLQVIHSPGHTPGSITLYHPKRKILFCGDTAPYTLGKLKKPNPYTADHKKEMASIRKLAEIECQCLLPNDCNMVLENAQSVLKDFCSKENAENAPSQQE
jgi:glyoxylase-like metal-dependent hydrolase (beta-lactamase superfamily II)